MLVAVRSDVKSVYKTKYCISLRNNLEQVIYSHGAQANSAFHPFGVGK